MAYSRSGANQMWIRKNSNELLEHLKSPNFNQITSIKSFDFSTLYTTIPQYKLKSRLSSIIWNSFIFKNGYHRYKFLAPKASIAADSCYTNGNIVPPPEPKYFSTHEEIITVFALNWKETASWLNFIYRYIDDVLSINNPEFENYLGQMYPVELEIKDMTESSISASYLELLVWIWREDQLHNTIYDKRDHFNFHVTNLPFLSSNIPALPAFSVFIIQLIGYACSSYGCFILRGDTTFKSAPQTDTSWNTLRKLYGRYGNLSKQYQVSLTNVNSKQTFCCLTIYNDNPPLIRLYTSPWSYRARPFTKLWHISIEHLRRMWHADKGRFLLRAPGSVPLGLAYFLLLRPTLFPNFSLFFRTMHFEYILALSLFCVKLCIWTYSWRWFRTWFITFTSFSNGYNVWGFFTGCSFPNCSYRYSNWPSLVGP